MGIPKIPSAKTAAKAYLAKKNEVPNPLDRLVEYTGDAETDSLAELEAIAKGHLGAAIDSQREAIARNNDTEFWFCVPFSTREQKDEVLAALGLLAHGNKYIDPVEFCKAVGVDLPPSDFVPKRPKHDKRLDEFLD